MLLKCCYWTFRSLFVVHATTRASKSVLCRNDFEIGQKLYTGIIHKHVTIKSSTCQKYTLLPVHTKSVYMSNPLLRELNQRSRTIFFFKSTRWSRDNSSQWRGNERCSDLQRTWRRSASFNVTYCLDIPAERKGYLLSMRQRAWTFSCGGLEDSKSSSQVGG